jgi:hypothetical protein
MPDGIVRGIANDAFLILLRRTTLSVGQRTNRDNESPVVAKGVVMANEAEIIRARAQAALDVSVSEDYVLQFLADLRNNMRDAEQRTRRINGSILLLATVFELINRHGISEATLFFVKLNSLDFALIAIPVVIAYLCYEVTGHVTASNDLYWMHTKVTEARYPSVRANNLDLLLIPVGDAFGQAIRTATFSDRSRIFRLLSWARFPLLTIVPSAAAYAFEVYALVQIFAHFGGANVLVWLSGILTITFIALAIAAVATESPHRDDVPMTGKRT